MRVRRLGAFASGGARRFAQHLMDGFRVLGRKQAGAILYRASEMLGQAHSITNRLCVTAA